MSSLKKSIGILGGTFDPVHFGHLRAALEIQQALDLSEVRLVPCFQPVHRPWPTASPLHRLTMLQLAVNNEPRLQVDDCEIQQQTASYTVDTLETLKMRLPEAPLCLIMGMDAFAEFPNWHRCQDILRFAHLIVIERPSYSLAAGNKAAALLEKHGATDFSTLQKKQAGCILLQRISLLDISATQIRQQMAQRKSPRYLLPDSVYDYILKHQIYVNSSTSLGP
jgi:nicotinate-nucleotide adenylyltransferase